MNKCVLTGNLVADPEVSETSSGITLCKFTLAVNRQFSNKEHETDFINIVAWRALAEFCAAHLCKGIRAIVSGSIQTNSYTTKNGDKRTQMIINADNVEFIGGGDKGAYTPKGTAQTGNKRAKQDIQAIEDDALPF